MVLCQKMRRKGTHIDTIFQFFKQKFLLLLRREEKNPPNPLFTTAYIAHK